MYFNRCHCSAAVPVPVQRTTTTTTLSMYLDGVECALRQIIVCGMPKSSQYALAREKNDVRGVIIIKQKVLEMGNN